MEDSKRGLIMIIVINLIIIQTFANWNENVDFMDGDHRLEFNYQL